MSPAVPPAGSFPFTSWATPQDDHYCGDCGQQSPDGRWCHGYACRLLGAGWREGTWHQAERNQQCRRDQQAVHNQ